MGRIIKTDVKGNFSVIELLFSCDGEEYTNVYVYDKDNNRREFIGATFGDITYDFTEDYIMFYSKDGFEVVFDIQAFDFVHDDKKQLLAYNKILEKIYSLEAQMEREENIKENEDYLKRRLK